MLQYDSSLDQYVEVDFEEFSSDNESSISLKSLDPLLVLRKKNRFRARSSFIHYFNLSRIIRKSGRLNVSLTKLPNKNISYIRDLGYTLLTIKWRWILLTICLVNFICFLVFSSLWMVVARVSGDFELNSTTNCVVNSRTFTGYFLLSVETITTIGYGYRYPTESCEGGWFLLLLQALLGIGIQGALISAVYVKTSKPFTKISMSIFSKTAVVCLRDGKLRFVFRIHDFTRKVWCGTTISLYFIDKEQDSLDCDFVLQQMTLEPYGLLIFPLEIEHVIDEKSPLWKFRPLDILQRRFEVVAVVEGSSNITGHVSQNRTSYSNSDILWGHRFKPCVRYDENKLCYMVDYKSFKQTMPFDTPLCSARRLADLEKRIKKLKEQRAEKGTALKKETNDDDSDSARRIKEERISQLYRDLFRNESVDSSV